MTAGPRKGGRRVSTEVRERPPATDPGKLVVALERRDPSETAPTGAATPRLVLALARKPLPRPGGPRR